MPLDSVNWLELLQRAPFVVNRERAEDFFGGKRILITGAGGWIGSALTRAISALGPAHLVLLEASERNLYDIDRALPEESRRASVLGSVTEPALVNEIFAQYRPQVIYHAAAFKHVPLMERNPFAAVKNNALGTDVLAQAAIKHGAEQLILLSTDKAADPVSMMGASKRIAELVLLGRSSGAATRMHAVRLGNVLGSEGSVIPLFLEQIRSGGPVTVTDPQARRYFLTTEDAVTLLLEIASMQVGPCILAPDLGEPVRVEALARYLIGREYQGPDDVQLEFKQLRPGDKMCETLVSECESYVALSHATLRGIASSALSTTALEAALAALQVACDERSLTKLLAAVSLAVPEYRPGVLLQSALRTHEVTGEPG